MLPSKGRRDIIIDGVLWQYTITACIHVVCHNTKTGEIIQWGVDMKRKWEYQVTPKLIEDVIRTRGNPKEFQKVNAPKKYITTTLPYANSVPHIGHAFEFIIGDALARYFRGKLGDTNVHFNLGLDEHGKKIYDASVVANVPTIQYLDELNAKWRNFCSLFKIEYNSFYRTSNPKHHVVVERFWKDCMRKGYIYKKPYQGSYCVGCESFKLDKDLDNGKCPDHPSLDIQTIEEENYFFTLTKFKKQLTAWFENGAYLRPVSKREELKNIIDDIQDISISRKRESVPWGISVPGDSSQVIYVWFEALLNYIMILGYYRENSDFEAYWKDSVQIFGPDNLKFQSAIFQGLLEAAEVGHTTTLLCHGTILDKDGKKMSKTAGNVIDPIDQLNKYGVDAVRYYALSGLQVYGNSGWDEEQLVALYNAHLADNYGNLVTRAVHLINLKNIDVSDRDIKTEMHLFDEHFKAVADLWESYDITTALHKLNDIMKTANQYITEKEPWSKTSVDSDVVLKTLYEVLDKATYFYFPVIPRKAEEVRHSLWTLQKAIVFPKITFVETDLKQTT